MKLNRKILLFFWVIIGLVLSSCRFQFIVRKHVYHPDLLGSFSIKKVGPVLASGVGYEDLSGVADGMAASGAFAENVKGELSSAGESRLREELLLYCGRDTLSLLEVFRTLMNEAS